MTDDLPESPTAALVDAAQRQDRASIEKLLVRHLPGLEAFVRLRMGPALRGMLTAPDLVQSVCREVLEDLSGFEFRGEATRGNHEFVNRPFASNPFVRVKVKQLNPAFEQILNDEPRAERVTTEARFVAHDHRVKLLPVRRIEQRNQTRPLFELGA